MPTERPRSVQEMAEAEFSEDFEKVVSELLAEEGPAPGAARLSEPQKLVLWGQADPRVDYDAVVDALMTTGISPEWLDPNNPQGWMLAKEHADNPEFLAVFTQPTQDRRFAEQLAALAERPFRLTALAGIDDPDERVRESDRLDRRWQASFGPADDAAGATPPGDAAPPLPPAGPAIDPAAPAIPPMPMPMPPAVAGAQAPAPSMPSDPMQMLGG